MLGIDNRAGLAVLFGCLLALVLEIVLVVDECLNKDANLDDLDLDLFSNGENYY